MRCAPWSPSAGGSARSTTAQSAKRRGRRGALRRWPSDPAGRPATSSGGRLNLYCDHAPRRPQRAPDRGGPGDARRRGPGPWHRAADVQTRLRPCHRGAGRAHHQRLGHRPHLGGHGRLPGRCAGDGTRDHRRGGRGGDDPNGVRGPGRRRPGQSRGAQGGHDGGRPGRVRRPHGVGHPVEDGEPHDGAARHQRLEASGRRGDPGGGGCAACLRGLLRPLGLRPEPVVRDPRGAYAPRRQHPPTVDARHLTRRGLHHLGPGGPDDDPPHPATDGPR